MEFKEVLKVVLSSKSKSFVARSMGVSRSMVYDYLSGDSCPSYDKVMQLYDALGKSVVIVETDYLTIEKRD